MVGGGPKEKKFVGMMLGFLEEARTELQAVNDKFGSPTYAKDLAAGIRHLLDMGFYGLYHLVNGGPPCSRYEVAVALCEILGRDDVTVEPISSAFFPLPAPARRRWLTTTSSCWESIRCDRGAMLCEPTLRRNSASKQGCRETAGRYLGARQVASGAARVTRLQQRHFRPGLSRQLLAAIACPVMVEQSRLPR